MEPQISPSFGYVKTLLKYLLISAQASEFCSCALDYRLCFKKYLQAPSLASFKWHLAMNETNFAFILARNLCINLRGCCQITSWEREWWGMENSTWKSVTAWNRREKLTSDWWTLCTEHIKLQSVNFLRGFSRREEERDTSLSLLHRYNYARLHNNAVLSLLPDWKLWRRVL